MAVGYNQTSDDLYDEYQTNVGIYYTGLVYNLDVGYETTSIYDSTKKRFVEFSPNYLNKNFTISIPGTGLLTSNGIGTVSVAFTGSGSDFGTNDITATIPGIGTGTPSKISVEMWAKINDLSGHYNGSVGNSGGMMFSFGNYDVWTGDNEINGTLGFNSFDATTVGLSTTTVQSLQLEGNWKHYVFVMTPYVSNTAITTENKIYIDSSDQGTLVNNRVGSGNSNNRNFANGQLKINGNTVGSFSDDYKLDMDVGTVRVYDRALTAAEVSQNYNALKGRYYNIVTTGLVLNLDAGNTNSYPRSGTTWTDLSGNSNNGTLINGPTFSSANGGSIVFDGTDDYVAETSGLSDSFLQGDWSISFWANFDVIASDSNDRPLLHHGTSSTRNGLHLTQRLSKFLFGLYADDLTSTQTLTTNTWYNVVFTLNNTSYAKQIYINGSIDNSHTGGGAYTGTGSNTRIGGKVLTFGKYFDGNMSSVVAYNRIITASEITQNYNATKGRFGL